MILEGTTSNGAVVPVQVTGDGKVVAEGLQGPEGPQGPQGPEGPPGPAGGYWDRTGTVVSPTNAGDDITTTGDMKVGPSGAETVRLLASGSIIGRLLEGTNATGKAALLTGDSTLGQYTVANSTDGIRIGSNVVLQGDGTIDPASAQITLATSGQITTPAVSLDPGTTGSPLVRDSSGRLLVGTTTAYDSADNVVIQKTDAGARISLQHSTTGQVTAGEELGVISFYSNDGDLNPSARVSALADADHSTGSKAGRLTFSTTPSGSTTPVERMRIDSQGDVVFQGAPIIRSPNGTHWAIEVDDSGNLSAIQAI